MLFRLSTRSCWRHGIHFSPVRFLTDFTHALPGYPPGLFFIPKFFTNDEQRTLLAACLHKLDYLEPRHSRRKRSHFWKSISVESSKCLLDMFAPDELYEFEEGHYDGVIRHFRETHLSSWPVEEFQGLKPILDRLYSLCPTPSVQTHLLHLASHGEILPHIDNVDASGAWILGVSLGAERVLRMQRADNPNEGSHRLSLHSGSVYLQRDYSRYNYLHSIETDQCVGQRLSIMIRDRNSNRID